MNVTVENLGPCKKLLRIELPVDAVDNGFAAVQKDFQKQAALPGFRPGKAPKDMVLKRYDKEINEEVKRKLMGDAYRQAVKDQNLLVVGSPDVEEIQFNRGEPMQFAATIETAPDFQLPEYRGLQATRENKSVSDEDVEKALQLLRDRQGKFENVDHEVREGSYVVVNYTGTVDDKPITDLAPTARGLTEQKNFWVEVKPDSFIPGFAQQLIGAQPGEQRTVEVDFPADFVTPELVGKHGKYAVEVVEVKKRILPEVDDAFAKSFGADDLNALREGVRRDLQSELNSKQSRQVRNQVTKALLDQVQCELPESLVQQETRSIVYDIVSENQQRGIPKEAIDQQKDEIYSAAAAGARDRVKASFILQRIAEKEGIKVTNEDLNARIYAMSQRYQMTPDKFVKELEKRNGIHEIYAQLVNEKVIDFLQQHAKLEDAPASAS